MEIVRPQNARAISEFYLVDFFCGGDIFEIFQKNKILDFFHEVAIFEIFLTKLKFRFVLEKMQG